MTGLSARLRDPRLTRLLTAALALVCVLSVYVSSLPPGVLWQDAAEAQSVPWVGGIFHDTGFPAYAMAGWVFAHLVPLGSVAWRMSFFSAILTAGASALLIDLTRRLGATPLASALAAVAFATGSAVWNYATHAGVNALELFLAAAALDSALAGNVVPAAFLCGAGIATHPVAMWFLPGTALVALAAPAHPLRRPWTVSTALAALAAGIAIYAYLPIRDAIITARHEDPTAALPVAYHPIYDYLHAASFQSFMTLVTGSDSACYTTSTLTTVLHVERYPSYAWSMLTYLFTQYGWLGMWLAAAGVLALRARPLTLLGLAATAFGAFPFVLNFRCWDPSVTKHYLLAFWVGAVFIALGGSFVARALERMNRAGGLLGLAALALLVAANIGSGGAYFGQSNDRSADAIISSVVHHTPDNAMIAAVWDYATPLYYASYVEQRLGHRLIVTNVNHAEILAFARAYPVYYFPVSANDAQIDGASVTQVPEAWPAMYRVVPLPNPAAQRPR